jgi:hypothetical protein
MVSINSLRNEDLEKESSIVMGKGATNAELRLLLYIWAYMHLFEKAQASSAAYAGHAGGTSGNFLCRHLMHEI